jgi:DNA-binding response OmpR family regulator
LLSPAVQEVHGSVRLAEDAVQALYEVQLSQAQKSNGLVMLLEDEALIALNLQTELEDAGYEVAGPFPTCSSALEWLGGATPDLAILDTVLKDGPCKDVALALARQGVPFVVYSGHREDLNTFEEFKNATWVEKPATTDTLLDALAGLRATA